MRSLPRFGEWSDEFDGAQGAVVHLALLGRICVVPMFDMMVSGGTEQQQKRTTHLQCLMTLTREMSNV